MGELEDVAAAEGADEVWLHARDTAFGFYERLGYVPEGEIFVSELTGIPHRTMRKRLDVGARRRRFSSVRALGSRTLCRWFRTAAGRCFCGCCFHVYTNPVKSRRGLHANHQP